MELTEKQKRFCDYFIELGNGAEAARRAGYKGNHRNIASETMAKPYISDYIKNRLAEKEQERIMSQDEVLEFLTSVARGEIREKKPVDLQTRVRATELLGKRHGLFSDKLIEIHNAVSQTNVKYVAEWGDHED